MIDIKSEIQKKFPTFKTKPTLIKKSIINVAKRLIHEDVINEFLIKNQHLKGFEFIDAVLEYFEFDYSVGANDIENIPTSGRVVIIANHPLGALDALSLLKLVSSVRKDVKIVANDFLAGFEALSNLIIHIDNFQSLQKKEGIKKVYESLENDEALIVFPAGEVSRITPKGVRDGKWHKGFLNFAKHAHAPILPVLIEAKNSKTFYTISALNKTFSTILLSDEMFKQKKKGLSVKIGELIAFENITPKGIDRNALPELYKKHTYGLKKKRGLFFATQKAIAHPEDRKALKKSLKHSQLLGKTADNKLIYLYESEEDSIILKEIGRLREISFRAVGEGVNKKRDLDRYDIYYKHIIVWDDEELEIVGAYRIGETNFIVENFGSKGLYTSTLFNYTPQMNTYLQDSIELGRSFVQPKYWGTRALDYLWYGIGAYLAKNTHIRYMFGPVTLSHSYPPLAKDLLVYYYSHYYGTSERVLSAPNPYRYYDDESVIAKYFLLDDVKEDFKTLKSTLSAMGVSVPTLYKQYSTLCSEGGVKFLAFNIDKDFCDGIDGFILTDVSTINEAQRKRYIDSHALSL